MPKSLFGDRALKYLLPLLVFFVVIFILYYPALKSGFISDDYVWIEPLNLAQVKHLFIGSWEHGNTLRPIMRLQFFADRILFKENAVLWHLENLILHSLVCLIGYLIILKTTKKTNLAYLAGLLFAIYPTNHEVVAWMSGRTHSFSLVLIFLTLYFLYQGINSKKQVKLLVVIGYILTLTAYLTYEIAFLIPIILSLILLFLDSKNNKAWLVTSGTWIILFILLPYRYLVLGNSMGSVDASYQKFWLAPIYNLAQLRLWYLPSTTIKLLSLIAIIILLNIFFLKIKNKELHLANNLHLKTTLLFFILSILFYLPFTTIVGVAPRFLYSSIFFFILGLLNFYNTILENNTKTIWLKTIKIILILLVAVQFISSIKQTSYFANLYQDIGYTQKIITNQILSDFPNWPNNKNMLFYDIPTNYHGIIAFLTYFNKSILRNYQYHNGQVILVRELSTSELEKILQKNPIKYKFIGFGKGVKRIKD